MAKRRWRTELRQEMNLILSNLDQRWLDAASREVSKHLTEILKKDPSREIEHVLAWVPFFPGEADLSQFIGDQLGHRRVYLPRVSGEREMEFVEIGKDWISQFEAGYRGIPGPAAGSGAVFDLRQAAHTAVLVPGLAFDQDGNWIGRASGYYNRFFARGAMAKALKIGVCWEMQIVKKLPEDYYHILLDWIVHEHGMIHSEPKFEKDADGML